ncbi:hypothetical protein Lal_00043063 [Lupinus albus]|nr:hypothetical protein Lal_00043063 [Lupinus albus]
MGTHQIIVLLENMTVWTDGLTCLDRYNGRCSHIEPVVGEENHFIAYVAYPVDLFDNGSVTNMFTSIVVKFSEVWGFLDVSRLSERARLSERCRVVPSIFLGFSPERGDSCLSDRELRRLAFLLKTRSVEFVFENGVDKMLILETPKPKNKMDNSKELQVFLPIGALPSPPPWAWSIGGGIE